MSSRDEAVKLAQTYMVDIHQKCRISNTGEARVEVENMIDLIIDAATDAATDQLENSNEIRMARARNVWVEKKRGSLSDQVVGLLEQAYEAGWHAREEKKNG